MIADVIIRKWLIYKTNFPQTLTLRKFLSGVARKLDSLLSSFLALFFCLSNYLYKMNLVKLCDIMIGERVWQTEDFLVVVFFCSKCGDYGTIILLLGHKMPLFFSQLLLSLGLFCVQNNVNKVAIVSGHIL